MDITAVRKAIADAARTVQTPTAAGLTATWFLPDAISEPHFFPAEYEQTFDAAHNRAMDDVTFTCRLLVGRADEQSSQTLMDALFSGSAGSLKQAIEAIRGPGGALQAAGAHDLRVVRTQANRLYEHNGVQYIGGEVVVRVIGPGGG